MLFTLATGTAPDRWDKARSRRAVVDVGRTKDAHRRRKRCPVCPDGSPRVRRRRKRVRGRIRRAAAGGEGRSPCRWSKASGEPAGSGLAQPTSASPAPAPSFTSLARSRHRRLEWRLRLIDRKGGVEPLKLPPGPYASPRVSPDGTRIAFGTDDGKEAIVWIYDLSGTSAMQRLTFGGNNRFPIWSSDGKRVAFQSDREGDLAIFWQSAVGGHRRTPHEARQGESHAPESWSPKADTAAVQHHEGVRRVVVDVLAAGQEGDAVRRRPLVVSHRRACFRPMDDGWPTRARNGARRRSTSSHSQPREPSISSSRKGRDSPHEVVWSPDGKELFYNPRAGGFEAVSVTTQPTFAFGNAVAVPRPFQLSSARRANDPTTSHQVASSLGLIPAGQTESGTAHGSADPGGPQLVRGAESARADAVARRHATFRGTSVLDRPKRNHTDRPL